MRRTPDLKPKGSIEMKYLALLFLLLAPLAEAKVVKLVWDASPETDIAGYKLYYWQPNTAAATKDCGNVLLCELDIEVAKAYSFAVTAYNTAGLESDFSNIVVYFEMFGTPLQLVTSANQGAKLIWLQGPTFVKAYELVSGRGLLDNIQWTGTNVLSGYTNNSAQISLIQGTNFFKVRPVFQGLPGYPDYVSSFTETEMVAPPRTPVLRILSPEN
jgi:hypothetical protein